MAGDWYYAQGDQRLGPVSLVELRSFLQSGRIQRATLVWTDGMQDWTAASEVRAVSGSEPTENLRVPMGPPAGSSSATPPKPEPPPSATPPLHAESFPPAMARAGSGEAMQDLNRTIRLAAWPLIALGLCFVVVSKGCDMLANRHAAYLNARTKYLNRYYVDERERLTAVSKKYQETLEADKEMDGEKRGKLIAEDSKSLQTKLDEATKQETAAVRDHALVVRDFEPSEQSWAYWRGLLFMLGTGVLIVGLIGAYANSDGADRWVCLVLLGIVVYAIYTSGPWH